MEADETTAEHPLKNSNGMTTVIEIKTSAQFLRLKEPERPWMIFMNCPKKTVRLSKMTVNVTALAQIATGASALAQNVQISHFL